MFEPFMIAITIFVIVAIIAFIAFCVGYSTAKHKYRKMSLDDMVKIAEKKLDIKLMKSKNESLKRIAKTLKKATKNRKKRAKKKSTSAIRNRFAGQNYEGVIEVYEDDRGYKW